MKKIYQIILIQFLFYSFQVDGFSQSIDLEGVVLDTSNLALSGASVVLLQQADSVMINFGITNEEGKFKIKKIKAGDYILQVNFIAYENYSTIFTIQPNQKKYQFPPIIMKASTADLDEVLVKAEKIPMQMRKDTLIYNADAFKTKQGAVVEDLLKKLPGVEVDRAGNIKAQGEDVSQVYVDGKEFFGNDPKIATKNLPADAIDKVQVYDKKSDMAEFSGIDDGNDSKTINLQLKDDKKNGYFGNLTAGYGTEQRALGKLNVNHFGKKAQFSVLANANNINENGFSFGDYLGLMGGIGSMMSGSGSMSIDIKSNSVPINFGKATGFTNSYSGGSNFNYQFKKNTKLNLSYFVYQLHKKNNRSVFRENFLDKKTFNSNEEELQTTNNTNHRLNASFRTKIDSVHQIIFRASLGANKVFTNSDLSSKTFNFENILENSAKRFYHDDGNKFDLATNLTYRRRFRKKGRIISAHANWGINNFSKAAKLNATTTLLENQANFKLDSLNQDQTLDNNQNTYKAVLSYTEPLSKRLFVEMKYTRQNFTDNNSKKFYDYITGERRLNAQLTNSYDRDYFYDRLGLSFQYNRKKINTTTAISWQHSQLNGTLEQEPFVIKRPFQFLLPTFRLQYDMATSRNLSFEYSTRVREPSVEQLQPIVNNIDPLNIIMGNPDLQPEYSHVLNTQFSLFDQFSLTNLFVGITGTYVNNKITNSQTIDTLFRKTTIPINVKKDLSMNAYLNFGTPLRFIKSSIGFNTNIRMSRGEVFINAQNNLTDRIDANFELKLSNRKKEIVDIQLGINLAYNNTKYSLNKQLNQSFWTPSYFSDLSVELKGNWNISSTIDYNIYPAEQFGQRLQTTIWEAAISKSILKNNRLLLKLSAVDILNQNQGINRSSNFNYIEEERIRSLGRYFLFSIKYKLSKFGNPNSGIDIRMDRRH